MFSRQSAVTSLLTFVLTTVAPQAIPTTMDSPTFTAPSPVASPLRKPIWTLAPCQERVGPAGDTADTKRERLLVRHPAKPNDHTVTAEVHAAHIARAGSHTGVAAGHRPTEVEDDGEVAGPVSAWLDHAAAGRERQVECAGATLNEACIPTDWRAGAWQRIRPHRSWESFRCERSYRSHSEHR